jgi:hypothetical protein
MNPYLAINVFDVYVYGVHGSPKRSANLLLGQTGTYQFQNLLLGLGKFNPRSPQMNLPAGALPASRRFRGYAPFP